MFSRRFEEIPMLQGRNWTPDQRTELRRWAKRFYEYVAEHEDEIPFRPLVGCSPSDWKDVRIPCLPHGTMIVSKHRQWGCGPTQWDMELSEEDAAVHGLPWFRISLFQYQIPLYMFPAGTFADVGYDGPLQLCITSGPERELRFLPGGVPSESFDSRQGL